MQKQRDTFYSLWPKTSPKNEKTFFFAVLSTNFCKHMSSKTKQLWLSSLKTFFLKHFFFFCSLKKVLVNQSSRFFRRRKNINNVSKKQKQANRKGFWEKNYLDLFFPSSKNICQVKNSNKKMRKTKGLSKFDKKNTENVLAQASKK